MNSQCSKCGTIKPGQAIHVDENQCCVECGIKVTNSMSQDQGKGLTNESGKPINWDLAFRVIKKHIGYDGSTVTGAQAISAVTELLDAKDLLLASTEERMKKEIEEIQKAVFIKCPGEDSILVVPNGSDRQWLVGVKACHNHPVMTEGDFSREVQALQETLSSYRTGLENARDNIVLSITGLIFVKAEDDASIMNIQKVDQYLKETLHHLNKLMGGEA